MEEEQKLQSQTLLKDKFYPSCREQAISFKIHP